jgi:hypothetical protein
LAGRRSAKLGSWIRSCPLFLNIRIRASRPPEDVCHTLGEERIFQSREPYTRSGASGVGGEENDCKDMGHLDDLTA